jgi:hypothetical protein
VISYTPQSEGPPIRKKPVTAVNAVTPQVIVLARAGAASREPVTRPPKTGYTGTGPCLGASRSQLRQHAADLRLRATPTGITAVTGFADKGAPSAPGSCETLAGALAQRRDDATSNLADTAMSEIAP